MKRVVYLLTLGGHLPQWSAHRKTESKGYAFGVVGIPEERNFSYGVSYMRSPKRLREI